MKSLSNFICIVAMSALSLAAGAQSGTDVKIRYLHPYSNDYYLTETSPDELFAAKGNPTSFQIETLGDGRYMMAVGALGKSGDYTAGRYAFDDTDYRSQFGAAYNSPSDNCYIKTGMNRVSIVSAIRKDRTLYVLGDEQVTDYSTLESLVQEGKVKKIDLTQENNFVFRFVPYNDAYDGNYSIKTEVGGMIIINEMSRQAGIAVDGAPGASYTFVFESDPPFVPDNDDDDDDDDDGPSGPVYGGGFAKITLTDNNHNHLGISPDDLSLGLVSSSQYPNANVTFYIDSAGQPNQFLLAMNAEKIGDCIKGKYVFKSSATLAGVYLLLELTDAIHYGDALYVLGDETVLDFSSLENLSSTGKIKKIDLNGENDFRFYFNNVDGSSDCVITTEPVVNGIWSGIGFYRGRAVIKIAPLDKQDIFHIDYTGETLKDRSVVAQPTPVRESRGSFYVSLARPEDGAFTATFDVALPQKFTLDAASTKLAASLSNGYDLNITAKAGGIWSFEIKPKAIRSGSVNDFREVANIAYTVDRDLEDGLYELKVQDLRLTLSDGTVIEEKEIVISVLFDSETGNAPTGEERINVWSSGGNLYVRTPSATTLRLYTPSGVQVERLSVGEGVTAIDLNSLPRGIYIVSDENGFVKKVSR